MSRINASKAMGSVGLSSAMRRRRVLLAGTALVGAVVAGMALMPNRAVAANECGAIPAGPNSTVNCTSLIVVNGIEYTPAPANEVFTLNVGNGTIVGSTTSVAPPAGLGSFGQSGATIAVVATGLPALVTGPIPIAGVQATSVMNINQFSVVTGSSIGAIVWTDGTGNDATVNNGGTVTSLGTGNASLGTGIIVVSGGGVAGSGNATGNNLATGVINAANDGLAVWSESGTATATNAGSITSQNRDGISTVDPLVGVLPTGGMATVTNSGDITAGRHGINAAAFGDSTVTLTSTSVINAGINSVGAGVLATSLTGNVVVNGDAASQTTSTNGPGIVGISTAGTTTIDAGVVNSGPNSILPFISGGVIGVAQNDATVNLHGKVTANGGLFGAAAISFAGPATLNTNGQTIDPPVIGGAAIVLGGVAPATVNAQNSTVTATDIGLLSLNLGTGNAVVNGQDGTVNQTTNPLGVGILALALGGGDAEVNSGAINAAGSGIIAAGVNSTINTGTQQINAGGLFGVAGFAVGGASIVNINGNIGDAALTPGITPIIGASSFSIGGPSTLTVANGVTVNALAIGLTSLSVGGESIITSTGATVNSGGVGIVGTALGGNSTIDAGVVNSALSGVIGTAVGGDSTVNLHGNVTVTGPGIFGAVSTSFGGNATVTSDAGVIVDPPIGMAAITFGPGQAQVNNNGTVNSTVVGLLGVNFGAGSVQINNNAGAQVQAATGAGVFALKIGPQGVDPGVQVNNAGIINAPNGPGVGVVAFDIGTDVNVQVNNTGPGASIIGGGGILSPTIGVLADGNVQINNTGGAVIDNQFGINNGNVAGLSIGVLAGNAVEINNTTGSTIFGDMGVTSLGSTVTLNNTSGAVWASEGLNLFLAAGDATINNSATIVNPGPTATFLVSALGNATINNTAGGLIQIGAPGAPTVAGYFLTAPNGAATINNSANNANSNASCNTLTGICVNGLGIFSGLGSPLTFNNAGGLVSMINGVSNYGGPVTPFYNTGLGDVTVINGNFNATGNSQLGVDAFLAGPNNSSADLLVITNAGVAGAVTGKTGIIVANGNNPGQYNPVGIPVVAVTSGLSAQGNWFIDPQSNFYDPRFGGIIDKGLFFYSLQTRPDPNVPGGVDHVLVSAPDREIFELTKAAVAAQTIWHETTGTWLERQADLRSNLINCGFSGGADMPVKARPVAIAPCPPVTPGVWMKAVGSWTNRDARDSFTLPAPFAARFDFDTSYKQNVWGVLGGIDGGRSSFLFGGDTVMVGVLGGYLSSKVDFDASPTAFDFQGGTAGAYATYLNGRFFIDAIFKADFLDMNWSAPSLAVFGAGSTKAGVTSYGTTVDTGYRFALSPYWFAEPIATLSWVQTSIDGINIFGTGIAFNDSQSLRGSLGGRLGAQTFWGTTKIETSVLGRVWDEFENPGNVVVSSAGSVLTFGDNFRGVFGEVAGMANMFVLGTGWSGFVRSGVKFNNDFTTVNGMGGVRYNW